MSITGSELRARAREALQAAIVAEQERQREAVERKRQESADTLARSLQLYLGIAVPVADFGYLPATITDYTDEPPTVAVWTLDELRFTAYDRPLGDPLLYVCAFCTACGMWPERGETIHSLADLGRIIATIHDCAADKRRRESPDE